MTPFLLMTLALGAPRPAVLATPIAVAPDREAQPPQAVTLSIEHSKLIGPEPEEIAKLTALYIREDSTKALESEHQVSVGDNAEAPAIVVELSWVDHSESVYGVTMRTQQPGHAPQLLETFECECIDSGLTAAVVERIPAALAQLSEPPETHEPVEPIPTETSSDSPPSTAADNGESAKREAAALGPVGYAGSVVAVGGLGMSGFGISELAKGQVEEPTSDEQRGQRQDHRPAGRAWLGAGLGVAAVGVAMIVVDATVLKKKRARALTLAPMTNPTLVGLSMAGRF